MTSAEFTSSASPRAGRRSGGGSPRGARDREAGGSPRGARARDEVAVTAYVERLGDGLTEAGMPRLAARVFARLLAQEDGRMTASDLTEALEVSPAAISGAVRYLTQTSMIGKERERGSRRDVYVVEADAWHATMLSRDPILTRLEVGMRAGVAAVGGTSTLAGRRLQLSVEFLELVSQEMARIYDLWEQRRAELQASWPDTP